MSQSGFWDDDPPDPMMPCPCCNGKGVVPNTGATPSLPRSRRTDPDTSQSAGTEYEDQQIKPDSIRHLALRPFIDAVDGLTGPELQEKLGGGLDKKETYRKRINELERMLLIRFTGITRPNQRSARKRQCRVYVITESGVRAARRLDEGKSWPPGSLG